ncbi:MFS transporter [Pediococcus siamensis]|uniref:MFS transporter n=1 Tax=Pediococcus siamensis TaxID=381829 RepID=UPI00399FFDD6
MASSYNKRALKIGLLSIALTMQASSAVSATVPNMVKYFSNQSTTSVQALITIPSFSVMLFILLSTWIVKLIGKRNTVLLGLSVSLIGGVIPAFTDNFTIVEVGRFLFGAGTGMYTPLAVSLIGDFFHGDEQRNLLGIRSAISAFGSSVATFIAGLLLVWGWHSAYFVYLVIIPVILLFVWGYPKKSETLYQKEVSEEVEDKKTKTGKVSPIVWMGILMLFVYFNGMMATYTGSGLAIQELKLSNQGFLSTSLAIGGILGAAITMFYGPIFRVLRHYTPVVVMIIGGIGMIGMAHSANMFMYTVFLVLTSSTALIVPYVYGAIMDDVPSASKNLIISIAMAGNNVASFLSPYTIALLGKLIGKTDSVTSFMIAAVLFLFDAVVFTFMALARKKQSNPVVIKQDR